MAEGKRRGADRVRVNREFDTIEEFISEYVSDISQSGVFIRSDDPLPKGTKVDLRFTVIMDEMETIEGIGEVVRVENDGMGVVFRELSAYSKDLLEKLLTQTR